MGRQKYYHFHNFWLIHLVIRIHYAIKHGDYQIQGIFFDFV